MYLQLQLDAVDARIAQAEQGAARSRSARLARPTVARPLAARSAATPARREAPVARGARWRLQSIPDPSGDGTGRGVLHRADCTVPGGGWLSRQEFEIALDMPDVIRCGRCQPEE